MASKMFVVCALSPVTNAPVMLSGYFGPGGAAEDYLYWSADSAAWLHFPERDSALTEAVCFLRETDPPALDARTLWVMPLEAARQLFSLPLS